jgi:hypothetical protein
MRFQKTPGRSSLIYRISMTTNALRIASYHEIPQNKAKHGLYKSSRDKKVLYMGSLLDDRLA